MVRVDLHVHSSASFDCSVDPSFIVRRSRELGLGPVCLTDHNTIAAASTIERSSPPCTVIIGEEILTSDGEIIGLFLRRPIAPGLDPEIAVHEIKAQGGIVYLPHPLDRTRPSLSAAAIDRVVDDLDVVEIFNARSSADANRVASELCRTLGALPAAGSDAHSPRDIGAAFVEMDHFTGAEDFVMKLKHAVIVTRPHRLRSRIGRYVERLPMPFLRSESRVADVEHRYRHRGGSA